MTAAIANRPRSTYADARFHDEFLFVAAEQGWSSDYRKRAWEDLRRGRRTSLCVSLRMQIAKRLRDPSRGPVVVLDDIALASNMRSRPASMNISQHPANSVKSLAIQRIIRVVTNALTVDLEELCGVGRRPAVVLAREIISLLARRNTTLSYPEIARGMGRPTHSTAIAAHERIKRQLAMDPQPMVHFGSESVPLGELVARLERELEVPT